MLHKGDPAPFTGDLFPVDVSVRMAVELETCTEEAWIELEHVTKLHRVEVDKLERLRVAAEQANAQRVELLQQQLEAQGAWYRSPPFVASVAATAAVLTLLTSAFLLQSTAGVAR